MTHEVMRVVRYHQLFEWHASLLQTSDKICCLTEANVAIVVAVNQ